MWKMWREAVFGVVAKRETVPTVSCSVRERSIAHGKADIDVMLDKTYLL